MGGYARGIVPMRPEMPTVFGGIATDDVPLRPSDLHEEQLFDLWSYATHETDLNSLEDFLVVDGVVFAALHGGIDNARVVARHAALVPTLTIVEADQFLAESGLENVGQD